MPPDRISGWLNSACNCWTVPCIGLQSAGSLLLCQEYRRTARNCQRYSPKWLSTLSMILQIITDFLKLLSDWYIYILNALLSLFLTAYHYSLGVFLPAKDTKAGAIEGCQTWMSLTLSDTECMSSLVHICQPQTWSHQDSQSLCIPDSHLPFRAAPPGFQPGLAAWRNSLASIPPIFPFTVCKPWPSARGMVLVALTAEYQECLKVGPFDVHY